MKITVNNLGPLKEAKFEIGDLTIICGENNTGKTYLTHATFGFLDAIQRMNFPIKKEVIDAIINTGSVNVPLSSYKTNLNRRLKKFSADYTKTLDKILAGKESRFKDTVFHFHHSEKNAKSTKSVVLFSASVNNGRLEIELSKDNQSIDVKLIKNKSSDEKPNVQMIKDSVSQFINWTLLSEVPDPHIVTAERAGISIFQPELDFTKNRVWELIDEIDTKNNLNLSLIRREFGGIYPRAIRSGIDSMRRLSNYSNTESSIMNFQPNLSTFLSKIIGGKLSFSKGDGISFVPASNEDLKLNILESSSTVRSLLDIQFYLEHNAMPGDILIIDEPELNLHPENQRMMARLFARLVNVGIKVFISTHSDYIIKELNTLIMLNDDRDQLAKFAEKEGYDVDSELIGPDNITAYMTMPVDSDSALSNQQEKQLKIVPLDISNNRGIRAESFDRSIRDMNRIQDEIKWGDHSND